MDIFRHKISDFVRYRKLVVAKYPDLDLQHADIISCVLKHLLLHGSLTTLEQLERGLVFYDEQLRVLNFHKEASNAKSFATFGGDRQEKGEPKGNGGGKDHGKMARRAAGIEHDLCLPRAEEAGNLQLLPQARSLGQ